MTSVVFAIRVIIAWLTALMTNGDDIVGDSFTKSFIKNKIFSDEFIFYALCFGLARIFNNASIELKNIFKPKVFHPRAGFFTSNAARAIH